MEQFEDGVFEKNEWEVQCWFFKMVVGGGMPTINTTRQGGANTEAVGPPHFGSWRQAVRMVSPDVNLAT